VGEGVCAVRQNVELRFDGGVDALPCVAAVAVAVVGEAHRAATSMRMVLASLGQ
jgi:hypothetical protein